MFRYLVGGLGPPPVRRAHPSSSDSLGAPPRRAEPYSQPQKVRAVPIRSASAAPSSVGLPTRPIAEPSAPIAEPSAPIHVKAPSVAPNHALADETKALIVEELLPVLDNLDRSIAAVPAERSADLSSFVDGIVMVRSQLEGRLAKIGVSRIDAVGQPFDPRVHDAVAVLDVDDATNDGIVVDEWARGYRLGSRLLRPAAVRVGRLRA